MAPSPGKPRRTSKPYGTARSPGEKSSPTHPSMKNRMIGQRLENEITDHFFPPPLNDRRIERCSLLEFLQFKKERIDSGKITDSPTSPYEPVKH
jgi:hypothetical protein